jgi:hypothetical protein
MGYLELPSTKVHPIKNPNLDSGKPGTTPPQDGVSHKEYLKVLYAEDRPRLFCLNLWLILWNKSLYMMFLWAKLSPKGEHKRGRAKGLMGKMVKQLGHPQIRHSKCKGSN